VTENEWLAERFEENRSHLRAVAYRMLGSLKDADDAVQEAWLRLSRSGAGGIENLGGWLTTGTAHVCLDMLRARTSRREESLQTEVAEQAAGRMQRTDPEEEALLADSVGLALLVVLDRLSPAERLAFVLHDMFAVSFDEIGNIVGRSATAARQLASRARRRVQGAATAAGVDLIQQRRVANAFLTALRAGDFEGLVAVLDPDVVVRLDEGAARPGAPREIRGAENWVRGAVAFSRMAQSVQLAVVNGAVGLVLAPHGKLQRVLSFTVSGGKIAEVDIIADPKRLQELDLAILES
jgi:RNA polymerase sigma-70 factor (ECF subfamily)